jgi:hypothetical protein
MMKFLSMGLKLISATIFLIILASCSKRSNADSNTTPPLRDGVYNNGTIATGTTTNSGVTAPGGFKWSEAQHDNTGVSNVFLGFACGASSFAKYKAADDFKIPSGQTWNISRISVYIMAPSGSLPPIDSLRMQIWNGDPSLPASTLLFGDLTTNLLSGITDSMTYIIQNSSVPAPGVPPQTQNNTWKLSANISKTLSEGTYWLVWQVHRTDNSDSYSPAIKVKGSRSLSNWNAKVFNAINVWQNLTDVGNPYIIPWVPQDLPFEIVYKY